jgi:hypothetical protein
MPPCGLQETVKDSGEPAIDALARCLVVLRPCLESLDLSCNPGVGTAGLVALCNAVAGSPRLRYLRLADLSMGSKGRCVHAPTPSPQPKSHPLALTPARVLGCGKRPPLSVIPPPVRHRFNPRVICTRVWWQPFPALRRRLALRNCPA